MQRPLQVYLDSSDFSNFSDPRRKDRYGEIESELIAWMEAGLIEIRFSYLNVIEASPVRREDIEHSKRRVEKIQQLCGTKCLSSTISIIEKEIRHPGNWETQDYRNWLFRGDGDWLPDIADLSIDDLSPQTTIREVIREQSLDRGSRRKLERQYFDGSGNLKPAAKAHLRKLHPDTVAEIEQRYPLAPGYAFRLATCIGESVDKKELTRLLMESIRDLRYWPAWYENHWERVAPVISLLRSCGRNICEGNSTLAAELRRVYSEGLASGLTEETIERIWKEKFALAIPQMYTNIVNRLSSLAGHEPIATDYSSAWQMRPSLATAIVIQFHIARRTALMFGQSRKPDEGDFGDVLHCVHLPFVDFFRADGFAASVISEAKLPFQTKIVPKLTQLPELIRRRLSELDGV